MNQTNDKRVNFAIKNNYVTKNKNQANPKSHSNESLKPR
jgi:hypothetical protein